MDIQNAKVKFPEECLRKDFMNSMMNGMQEKNLNKVEIRCNEYVELAPSWKTPLL